MHDKPTVTDPLTAAQASAEDAAIAELRAFVGLMVAKAEAAPAEPMAARSGAEPEAEPLVMPSMPAPEPEVARLRLARAEAAWRRSLARLGAARAAWRRMVEASARRALAGFLAGLRIAPRARRRRGRAAARKAADPPGGGSRRDQEPARMHEGRTHSQCARPP